MRLNLGCGGKKLAGHVNVDCQPTANPDVLLDIGREVFPWPDNSIEVVQAWHILEHIESAAKFFHVVKEVYRVLQPGGKFGIIVPHPRHDVFLNDPTHVRAITPDGMLLFSRKHAERLKAEGVQGVTTYAPYLGVDFDLQVPVTKILDSRFANCENVDDAELKYNNVIIEYRFILKAVK